MKKNSMGKLQPLFDQVVQIIKNLKNRSFEIIQTKNKTE